jgi:putative addiction module component (TIGR02574 family)
MNEKEILSKALKLPVKQRAQLASRLLESLEGPQTDDQVSVDAAWAKELEARLDSIDSGKVKMIPLSKVLEKLRKRTRRVGTQTSRRSGSRR